MSQDALELEVSILEALWIRNRSSHGRTRYFQRCRMVLQCIRNNNNDLLSVANRIQELARRIDGYQQYGSDAVKKKTSTNKKRDEQWTALSDLQQQQQHDDTSSASPVEWIQQEWKDLYQITTIKLPEILSRIEHAASALYTEVARGFFLPLCTVCLGTLGRIRVILLKFGREWLEKLREFLKIIMMNSSHVMLLEECEINTTSSTTTAWDTAMEAFVEPASETKVVSRRVEHQQDEEFWRQLGLTRPLIRKNNHEESGLAQDSSTRQDYKADPQSPSEDHDIGESVDWTTADEHVSETMVARSANNDDMAGIDRNAHVLASFQKEKSSQKRPRQDVVITQESSSTTKKKRKKESKKEKKSKKKKDIFDEIFGDRA